MNVEYREEPCRSALNRVQGMGFAWSLNPYMGCVHRCTFCYVRALACIEVLGRAGNEFGIITRGPLIVRDLDVLVEASKRANVGVTFSIPTLDPDIWRRTEPGTASPHQRLRALTQLVDAGVKVGVGMAPILPWPELLPDYERLYGGPRVPAGGGDEARARAGARAHPRPRRPRSAADQAPAAGRSGAAAAGPLGPARYCVPAVGHRIRER